MDTHTHIRDHKSGCFSHSGLKDQESWAISYYNLLKRLKRKAVTQEITTTELHTELSHTPSRIRNTDSHNLNLQSELSPLSHIK